MPRKPTGTAEWVEPTNGEPKGHYKVRLSLEDGGRPWVHLNPGPRSPQAEARARETAASYTERARREGKTSADFGLVPPKKRGTVPTGPVGQTMRQWLDAYTAMKRARGKTSTTTTAESHHEHHIAPVLGDKHVALWSVDDLRKLVRALDAKVSSGELKWKSSVNVWATLTSMLDAAVRSNDDAVRCRHDNPASLVEGPARGGETAKQYLYPSEFLRFVSCPDVPLTWRRAIAIAIYTYARAGELRALLWEDVDLEHGTIHVHRSIDKETDEEKSTKSGTARRIPIEPELLPLLRFLRAEAEEQEAAKDEGERVPVGSRAVVELPSKRDMARGLRRWLMRARVDRAELHHATQTRKAITFHDLRASGLTWMAVAGVEPMKIMQRAGHTDLATTMIYVRTAEELREGFGETFPTLPTALLRVEEERQNEERVNRPVVSDASPAPVFVTNSTYFCGADGTRTRGLRRDRPAL